MMPARRGAWLPGIFNDFFGDEWMQRNSMNSPAVNIIEKDDEYKVEIAAPGLTKDDFKVDLHDDNRLVVTMEREMDNDEKDEQQEGKYLRREFSYTRFEQSMILPDNVEHDNIDARVVDGVLTIHIPKMKEAERPRVGRNIDIR